MILIRGMAGALMMASGFTIGFFSIAALVVGLRIFAQTTQVYPADWTVIALMSLWIITPCLGFIAALALVTFGAKIAR